MSSHPWWASAGRHTVPKLLAIAVVSIGLLGCTNEGDADEGVSHRDLVAAAEDLGATCGPRNPQGVTTCEWEGDIDGTTAGVYVELVDRNKAVARADYEHRCLSPDDAGEEWVWYEEGSHWMFAAFKSDVTGEGKRLVSERLGEARDC